MVDQWCLEHPIWTIVIFIVVAITGAWVAKKLPDWW